MFPLFVVLLELSLPRSASANLPIAGISSFLLEPTCFTSRNHPSRIQKHNYPITILASSVRTRLSLSRGKSPFVLQARSNKLQSGTSNDKQNASKRSKRKEPPDDASRRNVKKRASQQDLHKLVKTMGLQPVP